MHSSIHYHHSWFHIDCGHSGSLLPQVWHSSWGQKHKISCIKWYNQVLSGLLPQPCHNVMFYTQLLPWFSLLTHLHSFDGQGIHPYSSQHVCVIQYEMVSGLCSGSGMFCIHLWASSASSAHLHGFDEVRLHPNDHPLHQKVLKHFIYML